MITNIVNILVNALVRQIEAKGQRLVSLFKDCWKLLHVEDFRGTLLQFYWFVWFIFLVLTRRVLLSILQYAFLFLSILAFLFAFKLILDFLRRVRRFCLFSFRNPLKAKDTRLIHRVVALKELVVVQKVEQVPNLLQSFLELLAAYPNHRILNRLSSHHLSDQYDVAQDRVLSDLCLELAFDLKKRLHLNHLNRAWHALLVYLFICEHS